MLKCNVRYPIVLLCALCLCSCASASKNIQPQINSLVIANRLDKAQILLRDDPSVYGPHNHMLFWLDKAMVAHLARDAKESTKAFDIAQSKAEELYTKSVSQIATSWIVNDSTRDYQPDEQEYVMLNAFAALEYASQGDIQEALVEARRMDDKLKVMAVRYQNPFAYFLSGLLWQFSKEVNAEEDARIDYKKAFDAYAQKPSILTTLLHLKPSNQKAYVFVFEYTGFIPLKVSDAFPIPLDGNHLTKISFPRYQDRYSEVFSSKVKIIDGGVAQVQDLDVVCDLGDMARKILASKKAFIMAKAGVRPLMKYAAQKAIEIPVRDKGGDLTADLLGVAGSLYNLATEEADVRSWQTLPNQIRLAFFELNPGTYDIHVQDIGEEKGIVDERTIKQVNLNAQDVKVIISRSWR